MSLLSSSHGPRDKPCKLGLYDPLTQRRQRSDSYRYTGKPARALAGRVGCQRLRELHSGLSVQLVEIKTLGDRDRNSPLAAIGGMGLFTKEIQRAVADRSVDVAVHSLKDLPTQRTDELVLAAVPEREDVADALVAPKFQAITELPMGARVGTSSPRRRAQLLFLRPDLQVVSIRGNVETRLKQALEGKLDAIVLASAGLHRLGLDQHITQRLAPLEFLPAVGQGALGVECRHDDRTTRLLLGQLDDPATRRAVTAERTDAGRTARGLQLPHRCLGQGQRRYRYRP